MLREVTTSIIREDARLAGSHAAADLSERLAAEPDVVLLFAPARHTPEEVLAGTYEVLSPSVERVGGASCAEIDSDESPSGSVAAVGIELGGVACQTAKVRGAAPDSFAVGRDLSLQAKAFAPNPLIASPDGSQVDSMPFLQGIQSVWGESLPSIGGVAVDEGTFTRTAEFCGDEANVGGARKGDRELSPVEGIPAHDDETFTTALLKG